MRIPRFTADVALERTQKRYRTYGSRARYSTAIQEAVRAAAIDQECYRKCYDQNYQDCFELCLKTGG
jgi:hypothetical protein